MTIYPIEQSIATYIVGYDVVIIRRMIVDTVHSIIDASIVHNDVVIIRILKIDAAETIIVAGIVRDEIGMGLFLEDAHSPVPATVIVRDEIVIASFPEVDSEIAVAVVAGIVYYGVTA